MSFELLHFRGSDTILKKKNMDQVVQATCETIEAFLYGSLHKRGMLIQALEEADWRQAPEKLKILNGRRYSFKGWRNQIALDGNFASYESIWDSLLRLQIGYVQKKIDAGIVLVTGERSSKSHLGRTKELIEKEIELLFPTISVPVTIAVFDLGKPGAYLEVEARPEPPSIKNDVHSKDPKVGKPKSPKNLPQETGKPKESMTEKLDKLEPPAPEKASRSRKRRTSQPLPTN